MLPLLLHDGLLVVGYCPQARRGATEASRQRDCQVRSGTVETYLDDGGHLHLIQAGNACSRGWVSWVRERRMLIPTNASVVDRMPQRLDASHHEI